MNSKYKLIINLKGYEESTADNAIKIGKIVKELESIANKKNVQIIVASQYVDLKDIVNLKVNTFSQHIDSVAYGANTGHVVAPLLSKIKVKGSLISHSEKLLSLKEIEERVLTCKKYNLFSCVCARNSSIAEKIAKFKPNFIAVEPKELIGGNISISTAKPNLIVKSVNAVGDIPLLVGAGVKNSEDVKKSIELGASGILVASGVAKAKNPKKAIEELLSGF